MSYEKDPHVRERNLCYYLGGSRVPLRLRPSKYSRWIDHPRFEITKCEDKDLLYRLRKLITKDYTARVRGTGKDIIAVVDWPSTGKMADRIIVMRAKTYRGLCNGFDGREYYKALEREREEDRRGPEYVEEDFLGWAFNRDF